MTGLDKMKDQILNEANNSAKEKVEEAKAKADQILAEAEAEAKAMNEKIAQKSQADVANYRDRVKSSCDLQRRKAILQAKQDMIASVLDKAFLSLKSVSDSEYFDMIKKMLDKFVLGQEGEIYFSSADLQKMPQGFEGDIQSIAESKGGKLTLSKEGRDIEGGFVLAYGGIEENCTLKAMFDSKRDELSDKVRSLLFS